MNKFFAITLLTLGLVFILSAVAVAQNETVSSAVLEEVSKDENIQAADLGVKEPRLLPGNPFYFLKNWGRGLSSLFTFNAVAKAELKLKFANEKLIEAKKLAEIKPEKLAKALQNYEEELTRLQKAAEKIKVKADNTKLDKFLDKFVNDNLKQQKLLDKLEKDLPNESYEALEKVKEGTLVKFSDIGLKLASPAVIQEKIIKATETEPGSNFKHFKNLEVLQQVAEKVPEQAKVAIEQAMENSLKRLKGDLEKMSPEDREKFKDYVANISGNELRHLAIIDELKTEEVSEPVREEIAKAKEKALTRVEERLKEYEDKQLTGAKKEFLQPLTAEGKIENLRVVKEMENNLSPTVKPVILETKKEVVGKVVDKIVKAETPEQQNNLLEKLGKNYDMQQLEALKELEETIPAEKKEFYEQIKEKATSKMKEELARTQNLGEAEKTKLVEKMAGDSPEHIKISEEFKVPQEVVQKTAERIANKVEAMKDPEKIEILKNKLEEEAIKSKLQEVKPGVIEKVEEKSEAVSKSIDAKTAQVKIQEAKDIIAAVEKLFAGISIEDPVYLELKKSNFATLLETAKKHLAKAEEAFKEGNFGEAFGQATAAWHNANNAQAVFLKITTRKRAEAIKPAPTQPETTVCSQVITPAIGPGNVCKEFPTSCDVPTGWSKIDKCPVVSPTPLPIPIPAPASSEKFACCRQEACKLMTYEECFTAGGQQRIGVSSCSPNPCIVIGPKKYPSGSCTPGEVINYKCSDGTSLKWCTCDDLGWDCPMYKYAERLCPATKEIILEAGQEVPATCAAGEALNTKCSDGRTFRACICEELGNTGKKAWECGLEPICPQPGPPTVGSVNISGAVTSDLFVELQTTPFGTVRIVWTASEPVTSRLEYGPTTSYGSTAGTDYFGSTYQGAELPNLQPDITYHFRIRIRDKDITPNTAVTKDYTFIIRRLPELFIQPISVDHFNGDTPNKIHVKILNEGVAPAPKGFVVKIYVEDNFVGEIINDSELAAGASADKTLDYTFSSVLGSVTIKAVIDATNLVAELNEKNNETQYGMSLHAPGAGQ